MLEGELAVKRNGQTSILHQGKTAVIEPGVWHDWWNASDRDARVRVEITPGERFVHMIETFFGLARLGYTDSKGLPFPLQLALCAREFSDVVVFRSPPLALQRTIFAALARASDTALRLLARLGSSLEFNFRFARHPAGIRELDR